MPTTQQKVAIKAGGPLPRRPGVGRGAKVRAAVLAATLAELTQVGYADLSVEGVAQRAGVHKTTVYRRWPDRQTLVAEALTDSVARDVPVPDTGSLEGDLRTFARSLVGWLTSPPGEAIFATLIAASRVPEIAPIKRALFEDRFRRHEPLVTRAIARGELPHGTDPAEVIKTVIAPIYLRLLITAEPINAATADAAAAVALAAARAGVLRPPHARPAGEDQPTGNQRRR